MEKYAKSAFIFLMAAGIATAGRAQSTDDSTTQHPVAVTPSRTDSSRTQQALEASLSKAAAAAEKAAGKIKIIVENKADKLAKTSQPYIESLAASTASLIEKLAQELEKVVDDSSSKKSQ